MAKDGLQHSLPPIHLGGKPNIRSTIQEVGVAHLYENPPKWKKGRACEKIPPKVFGPIWRLDHWISWSKLYGITTVRSPWRDIFSLLCMRHVSESSESTGWANFFFPQMSMCHVARLLLAKTIKPLTVQKITKMPLEGLKIVISSLFPLTKICKYQEKSRKKSRKCIKSFQNWFYLLSPIISCVNCHNQWI